jgi:hypothetical protein
VSRVVLGIAGLRSVPTAPDIFMGVEYRDDDDGYTLVQVESGERRAKETNMPFCDHCQGQRFDRAQVLRALRATGQRLRDTKHRVSAERVLAMAIQAVRSLEIPHLEAQDGQPEPGDWVH